jgi:exodeoxyribonuclease-3
MILAGWNVNGLRSIIKKGHLLDYLKKYQPDIIGLQEIKARPQQIDKGFIKILQNLGYKYLFFNPAVRGGYSGTAIFSKLPFQEAIKGFSKVSKNFLQKIYEKYFKDKVKYKEFEEVILKDGE